MTTAYKEFALEGYEYNVTDYLVKPTRFGQFLKTTQKVLDKPVIPQNVSLQFVASNHDFIFIKSNSKLVKIMWNNILRE